MTSERDVCGNVNALGHEYAKGLVIESVVDAISQIEKKRAGEAA